MRSPREPGFDLRRFMGGVVVHDDVDVQIIGNATIDLLEEIEEFPGPVALIALADDEARGNVERGEQGCGSVADIIVRPALGHTRHQGQNRLFAVECLYLALLVDAKDQSPIGR